MITRERLIESHNPEYVAALEEADSGEWKDRFAQFNLGVDDCPVFKGMFDYTLLYCSATLTGVDLITEENANVVFNPLGGFHHSSRDHAEGFCYVNDVIAAIDLLLARDYRVAYIDIDAHHGNGVQDAYYRDDRVLTISIHQSGKTFYPWGGFETEIGEDIGRGFNMNIPLPPNKPTTTPTRRCSTGWSSDRGGTVRAVGRRRRRRSRHTQSDPLADLCLTNNGMEAVVKRIQEFSRHLLLLGGGGYALKSTTEAWCRMWAAANRIDSMPDFMLGMGGTFLGGEDIAGADIVDMTYHVTGDKKTAIMEELQRIAAFHEENTIPAMRQALAAKNPATSP